jgi:RecJ-like exonuclease
MKRHEYSCQKCSATGSVRTWYGKEIPCPECNGKGYVGQNFEEFLQEYFGIRLELQPHVTVPCGPCRGSGKVNDPNGYENKVDCLWCGGRGHVTVPVRKG